ncbi:unnamed protein product [Ectocarpus fasciculatus]
MFGTLVVQLPTAAGHKGGSLIVRHGRKKRVFAWEDPDGSYARRLGGGAAAAVAGTAARRGRGRTTSSPPSSLPVRCAAFYGDCEHELRRVTRGVRLCLLYNLVRTTPGPQPVAAVGQSGSAAQLRLSDAVAAWGRPGSSCDATKFIVPLEHEYTKASLSFRGLKGRDRAMADSLRACRDLDLYLVTIVKHENGHPWDDSFDRSCDRYHRSLNRRRRNRPSGCGGFDGEEEGYDDGYEGNVYHDLYGGEGYPDGFGDEFDDGITPPWDHGGDVSDDPEGKEMMEIYQSTIAAEDWVDGEDDSKCSDLGIDINGHEVLGCLPLDDPDESAEESDDDDDDGRDSADAEGLGLLFPKDTEPAEAEYRGYTGNMSPSLDLWYQRAALIFWPSSAKIRVELENGPSSALRVARERSAEYGDAGALPLADLAMIVSLAETKRQKPRRKYSLYPEEPPPGHVFMTDARDTADVLVLCSRAGAAALDSSRRFVRLLAGDTPGAVETPGLVSEGVSRGVAALVRAVGWQAIEGEVLRLVEACSLEQAGNVAVLVEELSTLSLPRQQEPELQQDGAGVKVEVEASHQPEVQDNDEDVRVGVQVAQQPELEQDGAVVKVEIQAVQQPELQQQASGSTGALVASTYAEGITSNPGDLERVTSKEVPTIVRLLLLDLHCFSVSASSDVNPLLAFFSKLGAVHLPTDVLANAVHEFRGRLDGTTAAAASAAGSSNPAVTSGTTAGASSSAAAAAGAGGGQPSPHHSSAVVTLATGLYSRGFQDLGEAAVKTFAEDVLWLAASVECADGLEQGFVDAMVMDAKSGDSTQIYKGQGKLKAVLESTAVQAAVRGGGGEGSGTDGSEVFWRALVSERLVNLEAQAAPELCWRQPNAVFEKDPQIQQFLRGPASTMIYRGTRGSPFTYLNQANVFTYNFYRVHAKAVARVDGHGALVEITKTMDLHEERVKAHAEVRAEVDLLRSLMKRKSRSKQKSKRRSRPYAPS